MAEAPAADAPAADAPAADASAAEAVNNLPVEMLIHILGTLPLKDLINAAFTCKLWMSAAAVVCRNKDPIDIGEHFTEYIARNKSISLHALNNFVSEFCLVKEDIIHGFQEFCLEGRVDIIKWMYDAFEITDEELRVNDNCPLRLACMRGHTEVAKWLHAKVKFTTSDVCKYSCGALRNACLHNSIETAEWLVTTFGITKENACINNCDIFELICINGKLEIAKWFIEKFDITADDIYDEHDKILQSICEIGHLELLILVSSKIMGKRLSIHLVQSMIYEASNNGHLDVIEWIVSAFRLGSETFFVDSSLSLTRACMNGHLKLAQWVCQTFDLVKWVNSNPYSKNCILTNSAGEGRFECVKWFLETFQINPDEVKVLISDAFQHSCAGGHLEIAQLLASKFELTSEDVRVGQYTSSLIWAASNGFLDTAKWLHKTFGFTAEDASDQDNYALKTACREGHLEAAKWLTETFNIVLEDIYMKNDLLHVSCERGHLETAKWCFRKFGYFEENRSYTVNKFRGLCLYGQLDVAKWFRETFRISPEEIDQENSSLFLEVCIGGHLEVAQWLKTLFKLTARDIRPNILELLNAVCQRSGFLNMVRWLFTEFKLTKEDAICVYESSYIRVANWLKRTYKL